MYINCKTSLLELKFLIIRINVRFYFIKLARRFFFFVTFANIDGKRKIIFMIKPKVRWKILWIKSKQRIRVVRFQENKATRKWNGGNLHWDNSPQNLNLMTMIVISSLRLYRVIPQQNQLENSLKGIIAFNKFLETART